MTEVPNAPGILPPVREVEKILHRYGNTEMPLVVQSDKDGVIATVPEATKETAGP